MKSEAAQFPTCYVCLSGSRFISIKPFSFAFSSLIEVAHTVPIDTIRIWISKDSKLRLVLSPLFENWDFPFVTLQKKRSATFCGEQRLDRTYGMRPDCETSLLSFIDTTPESN